MRGGVAGGGGAAAAGMRKGCEGAGLEEWLVVWCRCSGFCGGGRGRGLPPPLPPLLLSLLLLLLLLLLDARLLLLRAPPQPPLLLQVYCCRSLPPWAKHTRNAAKGGRRERGRPMALQCSCARVISPSIKERCRLFQSLLSHSSCTAAFCAKEIPPFYPFPPLSTQGRGLSQHARTCRCVASAVHRCSRDVQQRSI